MATDTGALRERLLELLDRVDDALQAPAEVEDEQEKAMAGARLARQELVRFYARPASERDAKTERVLREAVKKAEEAADQPWSEKAAGARMAADVAREEHREFVRENFDALAAEYVTRAVEAWRPYCEAVERTNVLARPCLEILDEWPSVMGPAGIPLEDLPREDAYLERPLPEKPMPRSLRSLADEVLNENGGGE
jgi:hypothetical protein